MTDATEAGRTGRKRAGGGEPAPAPTQPEDAPELGMDEGEMAVGTGGHYVVKAPRQDVYHAYHADHEPFATIRREPDNRWSVKLLANGALPARPAPGTFSSAVAARAFLTGYEMASHESLGPNVTGTGQPIDAATSARLREVTGGQGRVEAAARETAGDAPAGGPPGAAQGDPVGGAPGSARPAPADGAHAAGGALSR